MSNASGPTTWFSGKSAPEDQKGPSILLLFAVAFVLYSPVGVIVALACFFAFNYYRVSHKVIAGAAAIYGVPYVGFLWLFSSPQAAVAAYHQPLWDLIAAVKGKGLDGYFAANAWGWFTTQLPLSILLGLVVGSVWTAYKWIRRPAWEDNERIPGPIHRLRRRRVIAQIASDTNGPSDGATLGVDPYGKRIVQTHAEAAAHTLLAGGSGAGKTTTMMIGIRDAIRRGEPVCVVDLKGAADLPEQLAVWSQRYGRRFLHWSITDRRQGYKGPADGPAFYDPIGRGDPSRKKDLLIGSEKWDVEYYKSVNENYLQTAFQIAELNPNPKVDAFTDLAYLLDLDKFKARCCVVFLNAEKTDEGREHAAKNGTQSAWWNHYPTVLDPYTAEALSAAAMLIKPEESERSAIRNMAARVQKLRQSTAGAWLKQDKENGRDIDLRRVADEGWVVVFSLDSSNYEQTSKQVAGLIIQDLKTLSSELRHNPAPSPFHVYVDEFSAIGSTNITGMLARARDAKMPCMLSTQALADLRKEEPAFLEQVLGIVNSFIIHRANTEADAEVFAGLTGKKLKWIQRMGVEKTSGLPGGIGTGAGTGQGTIEQQEDYVVPASKFQALKRGELVYIAKSPTDRVAYPVTVVREDEMAVTEAIAKGDSQALAVPVGFVNERSFEVADPETASFPVWEQTETHDDTLVIEGDAGMPVNENTAEWDDRQPVEPVEPVTETAPVVSTEPEQPEPSLNESTPSPAAPTPRAEPQGFPETRGAQPPVNRNDAAITMAGYETNAAHGEGKDSLYRGRHVARRREEPVAMGSQPVTPAADVTPAPVTPAPVTPAPAADLGAIPTIPVVGHPATPPVPATVTEPDIAGSDAEVIEFPAAPAATAAPAQSDPSPDHIAQVVPLAAPPARVLPSTPPWTPAATEPVESEVVESVFGGGSVEWESAAGGWDSIDVPVAGRAQGNGSQGSGERRNLPTNKTTHSNESDWNE